MIRLEDAEWAIDLIRHFASRTMRAVERHVADNEISVITKKMLDIIRTAGQGGLTKTELTRTRSSWIGARAMKRSSRSPKPAS